MNELKCLILNCSPYGPQNDKGIGKNTTLQYIPLDKSKMTNKDKSYGYYISYNVLWDKSEKEFFNFIKKENLILTPVIIKYDNSLKHCTINSIEKI